MSNAKGESKRTKSREPKLHRKYESIRRGFLLKGNFALLRILKKIKQDLFRFSIGDWGRYYSL